MLGGAYFGLKPRRTRKKSPRRDGDSCNSARFNSTEKIFSIFDIVWLVGHPYRRFSPQYSTTRESTRKTTFFLFLPQLHMMTKTVAILYATKGGMGDVGKFAMTLSKNEPSLSCNVLPVALSIESSSEGTDKGLEVDVEDLELKKTTEELLGSDFESSILKIDVSKDSAEQEIADAIEGADAVVSCLGNRQPGMERWCSVGTQRLFLP